MAWDCFCPTPLAIKIGMNTALSEIAFILDRSGSMQPLVEPAISGFNRFLAEQQAAPGLARLTLVLFDDEYLVPVESIPVAEVVPLDTTTYVPRASTALLDAIGRTIDELGARLTALPEESRPGKVIVAILTDGLENASRHFTWRDVSARIRHQSEVYKWQFLFLGANQDAIATAAQLSIGANDAATFVADGAGHQAGTAAFSRRAIALRRQASGDATLAEVADAATPLQTLVKEEDEKRRRC